MTDDKRIVDPSYTATVIICTCNRAESLKETLHALELCEVSPACSVELLVVDNASTDSTRVIVELFASKRYTVNYLYEAKRGKGNAYNAGIAEAAGEICIFTDDDVRPSERWLLEHIEAYSNADVAAVQGRIDLEFDSPPPEWMEDIHRSFLAETAAGDEPIFPYPNNLVGANMSFRKTAALDAGPFCPLLGPGRSGFWDESEFTIRMKKKGYQLIYSPGARVRHVIPAARLTFDYFNDAAFRQGVSCYIAEALGAFTVHRRPFYELVYANLRHLKMLIKAKLRRERYICTQDDLFFRMHMGVTWAYYQGMERLTRRFSS